MMQADETEMPFPLFPLDTLLEMVVRSIWRDGEDVLRSATILDRLNSLEESRWAHGAL